MKIRAKSVLLSRRWRVIESIDLTGSMRMLGVTGKVEVSQIDAKPVLAEAVPREIDPTILIFEQTIQTNGDVSGATQ